MRIEVVGYGLGLLLMLALTSACSTAVPATVTWGPNAVLSAQSTIMFNSNAQDLRIAESIKNAGLRLATGGAPPDYMLQVQVGSSRSSSDCGTVNNVAYILNSSAGRILVLKGRGPTGSCSPNIFDDMSQLLARQFGIGS
jgi:hypothetical protein